MPNLELPLTSSQHDLLKRIAAADDRRLNDFIYLLLAEGLRFYFCEKGIQVKKQPEEYTQEEKDQEAKNKELEKSEGWSKLNFDERKEKGFKYVDNYFRNYGHDHGYVDFIDKLQASIKSHACD